jgi:hypothetical protein
VCSWNALGGEVDCGEQCIEAQPQVQVAGLRALSVEASGRWRPSRFDGFAAPEFRRQQAERRVRAAFGSFRLQIEAKALGPKLGSKMKDVLAAPRGAARELAVEVRNGGLVDLGEIALAPSAALRLRPLRADGSVWSVDVPDVELTDATGQRISAPFDSIVEGGERVLTGVPVGQWFVRPRSGECVLGAPIAVELRADAAVAVDWPLRIGLGVELVFEVPKGELAAAATERLQVRIRDAEGGTVGPFDGWFDADRPGGFSLVHTFDVGSYEIEAATKSGRRYRGAMLVRNVQEDPTRFVVTPLR